MVTRRRVVIGLAVAALVALLLAGVDLIGSLQEYHDFWEAIPRGAAIVFAFFVIGMTLAYQISQKSERR